mmetsp:Transcript_31732/g.79684  ORF Transcript_31732/g.79684 Transcript_31732/m.79684 type:complete len:255 (+) Transcript_31732:572-1336(+)
MDCAILSPASMAPSGIAAVVSTEDANPAPAVVPVTGERTSPSRAPSWVEATDEVEGFIDATAFPISIAASSILFGEDLINFIDCFALLSLPTSASSWPSLAVASSYSVSGDNDDCGATAASLVESLEAATIFSDRGASSKTARSNAPVSASDTCVVEETAVTVLGSEDDAVDGITSVTLSASSESEVGVSSLKSPDRNSGVPFDLAATALPRGTLMVFSSATLVLDIPLAIPLSTVVNGPALLFWPLVFTFGAS